MTNLKICTNINNFSINNIIFLWEKQNINILVTKKLKIIELNHYYLVKIEFIFIKKRHFNCLF